MAFHVLLQYALDALWTLLICSTLCIELHALDVSRVEFDGIFVHELLTGGQDWMRSLLTLQALPNNRSAEPSIAGS